MPTVKQQIDDIIIEWDSDKAAQVKQNHGVTFEEALSVLLYDDYALTNEDYREYDGEQRYITLGVSKAGRLLYVVWTLNGFTYRLISARKANKHEQKGYYHG